MPTSPTATERRIYPRPPIVEAIIDIRYQAATPNEEVLQVLQAALGGAYKGPPKRQRRFQISASVDGEDVTSSTEALPHLTFLRSTDGLRLVGCAPGNLSVHVLAPYPGWERFLDQAREAVQVLPQGVRGGQISALAVRYIDRIALPHGAADRFFTIMPSRPSRMPTELTGFHFVVQSSDPKDATSAQLTVASAQPGADGKAAFIYDLNVQRTGEPLCAFDGDRWIGIVEQLHQRQREIFEGSITDEMRSLFE